MNIGFYGHSNCAYQAPNSFLNIIASSLDAKIVNTGVKEGSEDRILFELKKTNNLDIAIIFHSMPKYIFLPNCDRDLDTNSFSKESAHQLLRGGKLDDEFTKQYQPKFSQEFNDEGDLYNAVSNYKRHFYHKDLMLNHFYGALIQIDQYLLSKNIFSIHILDNKHRGVIPTWFEFKSGIVDYSIMKTISMYPIQSEFVANCISEDGNKIVAEILLNMIAARGREVKCARP